MGVSELIDKTKEAYFKLKRTLYYEKLDLISRNLLVEFERNIKYDKFKLDEKLEEIAGWIDKLSNSEGDDELIPTIEQEIKNIQLSIYIKEVQTDEKEKKCEFDNFITDEIETSNLKLVRENTFIKTPISLQILGVLWITEIGFKLDQDLAESVYGNRLQNLSKTYPDYKGRLFKQYHYQYSKWWKKGLAKAKSILRNDEQDVVLINFDIKNFYHAICLDTQDLRKAVSYEELNPYQQSLHKVTERVLIKYNQLLNTKSLNKNKEGLAMPIGYLPSSIIANWYLTPFDKSIINKIRPSYYGRYVDDLFLVFKSIIPKSKEEIKNDKNEILNIKKQSETWEKDELCDAEYRFLKYLGDIIDLTFNEKSNKEEFEIQSARGLSIQKNKLFVYELSVGSPANLIENFIKEQRKKSSEFRFESEESDTIESDFGDILFEQTFENDDASKAKIKKVSENKFEISVYTSRLIRRLARNPESRFKDQLIKIVSYYRGINCINNWWLWEKITLAIIISGNKTLFKRFIKQTNNSINALKSEKLRHSTFKQCQVTMRHLLRIAIKNGVAGNPNFLNTNLKSFLEDLNLYKNEEAVRKTAFARNDYFSFPLIALLKGSIYSNLNYHSVADIRSQLEELDFGIPNLLKYYCPIPVKYWQVAYIEWCKAIYGLKTKSGSSIKRTFIGNDLKTDDLLKLAFELYFDINYSSGDKEELRKKHFFKSKEELIKDKTFTDGIEPEEHGLRKIEFQIAGEAKDKIRFGLVNEYVDDKNYKSSAKGIPVDGKRLEINKQILDEAQRKGCDIVIQPELAVPHPFIPDYCEYADKHQLGIVAGVEHLRIRDVIFNFILTVIPVKIEGIYKDAIPIIRLKNHYAHIEEVMVNNFRATVPKPITYEYHLLHWLGLYFTNYYCFELADINHRTLFQGEIDVLIAPVWNPDTNYYNCIVDTSAREIHCIFSQVNTANYGDTRWTLPAKTESKNQITMKGGTVKEHPYIIALSDYYPKPLREFQNLDYNGQKKNGQFKPTPPDYPKEKAKKRLNNESFYITE